MGHAAVANAADNIADPEFNIPLTRKEKAEYFMVLTRDIGNLMFINVFQASPKDWYVPQQKIFRDTKTISRTTKCDNG